MSQAIVMMHEVIHVTRRGDESFAPGSSYVASGTINGDRKGTNWGETGGWSDATVNSYPDWQQVTFNGNKTIDEIDVFTLQDNFSNPSEPTESMTFSQFGLVNFQVQYWNGLGWATVSGGSVTNNNKVWKKINFSQITTNKIRVNVTSALSSYSRMTELEAWGPGPGTNYTYDAAGNVTNDGVHIYGYDAENRLVSVDSGNTASYAYDYSNRRYKKSVGSTVTHYIWQGSQVLAEHNGTTGAVQAEYIYSGSRMIAKVASGSTQYFLSDRLSTRLVLDANGNVLGRMASLPFGEDFGESGTQEKHHFTSYDRDVETVSDYAVNRQYGQNIGRFNRTDPAATSAKKESPQSWNRYSYSGNDPINMKDPLGLFLCAICGSEDPCRQDGPSYLFEGFALSEILCDIPYGLIPSPDPQDNQESCRFGANTVGKPIGFYPRLAGGNQRSPAIDPSRNLLGPNDVADGWVFFVEMILHGGWNTQPDDWTITRQARAHGWFTIVLEDNTISSHIPNDSPGYPIFFDDPIRNIEDIDRTKLDWDGYLVTFIDAPGMPYYVTRNGKQYRVHDADMFFDFTFTATNTNGTSCTSTFSVHLTVTNQRSSW